MPIYAYRCEECGFAKDVLQKMSDEPLTVCLACGKPGFKKQVTAAGFQLKGSGWYVTDFRDGKGSTSTGVAASAPTTEGVASYRASDAAAGSAAASPAPVATSATVSANSDTKAA